MLSEIPESSQTLMECPDAVKSESKSGAKKRGRPREPAFTPLPASTKRLRVQEAIDSLSEIIRSKDVPELLAISQEVSNKLDRNNNTQSGSKHSASGFEQVLKEQPLAAKLLGNIRTLVTDHLPENCYYKPTIIGSLFEGIPSELAQTIVDDVVAHPSLIRKYPSHVLQGTTAALPSGRFNPNNSPRKPEVSELEESKILEFVKAHCPTPSGSRKERYIQTKGRLELYADYVQWCLNNEVVPRSYPVFSRFLFKFNVREMSAWYGHFSCPYCHKVEKDLIEKSAKAKSRKEKNAATKELQEWRRHQFLKKYQRQVFECRLASLQPVQISKHALLIVDFTCLEPESRENTRIQNMIVVVVFKDQTNEERRVYFDFLCGDPDTRKNDFFFVRRVFELFLSQILPDSPIPELRFIKSIQIWSDGGRKHFKNRFTMTETPSLFRQAGIEISWSFFACLFASILIHGSPEFIPFCQEQHAFLFRQHCARVLKIPYE